MTFALSLTRQGRGANLALSTIALFCPSSWRSLSPVLRKRRHCRVPMRRRPALRSRPRKPATGTGPPPMSPRSATRFRSKCCVGSTTPAPAPRAALSTSPISSKRTRLGRTKRRSKARRRSAVRRNRCGCRCWLKRYPPLSAAGQIRAAEILLNAGDLAGGTAALRGGLGRHRFQRARREKLSRQAFRRNPHEGQRKPARPAAVGREDRGGSAHAGARAAGLPGFGRSATGA